MCVVVDDWTWGGLQLEVEVERFSVECHQSTSQLILTWLERVLCCCNDFYTECNRWAAGRVWVTSRVTWLASECVCVLQRTQPCSSVQVQLSTVLLHSEMTVCCSSQCWSHKKHATKRGLLSVWLDDVSTHCSDVTAQPPHTAITLLLTMTQRIRRILTRWYAI